ncbi:MAG: hypothetical protein B7Z60_09165 [Ferrovum sp. 37-45-19]|nr:MAG: hypothetical protein B7Z65_08450 [Ferrovum sp. 21-44-67]OYV93293.1 MAG: hypothetical protein B7Z60_09165 [Ferrovum sp. 37-45-19]
MLNAYLFENLKEVREIIEKWIKIYNDDHPPTALGTLSPVHYQQQASFSLQECLLKRGYYIQT